MSRWNMLLRLFITNEIILNSFIMLESAVSLTGMKTINLEIWRPWKWERNYELEKEEILDQEDDYVTSSGSDQYTSVQKKWHRVQKKWHLLQKKCHLLQKKCHPLQKKWHPLELKKFIVFLFE